MSEPGSDHEARQLAVAKKLYRASCELQASAHELRELAKSLVSPETNLATVDMDAPDPLFGMHSRRSDSD